jgi:hypothetical protein
LKTVFVVGFYDPVKRILDERYPNHLNTQTVIWIRQRNGREANLNDLAGRLFGRLKEGSEKVLVLLGVPRGSEWIVDSVRKMLERGKDQYSEANFDLRTFENLGDRVGVQDAILSFEPLDIGEISAAMVRKKAGNEGRILCVSLDGKTQICDALKRAGFSDAAVEECFTEERIPGARNSNLIEQLGAKSKHYTHLLYAWDGLRTLKPATKGKYSVCYEAPTASMVVDLFRRWIVSNDD